MVCKYLCDDKGDWTWARVSRRLKALCTLCHVALRKNVRARLETGPSRHQPAVRSSTVTCGWQDTDYVLSRRCDGWMNLDWWILKFLLLASPSTTDRYCEPQTLLKTNSSCFTSEFVAECVYENDKKNARQRKRLKILKFFWLSTRVCASLIGLTFLWNCSFSAARQTTPAKHRFWPA